MADRIPFDSRLNLPPRRYGWGRLVVVLVLAVAAGFLLGGCRSRFDNCDVVRTSAECRAKCREHGAQMRYFSFDPTSTGGDCWKYSCACSEYDR